MDLLVLLPSSPVVEMAKLTERLDVGEPWPRPGAWCASPALSTLPPRWKPCGAPGAGCGGPGAASLSPPPPPR